MSARAQGFFEGLISQGLPSLFSLFLTPNSVGNAEMTLGGIDKTKFQGDTPAIVLVRTLTDDLLGDLVFASLPPRISSTWSLNSTGISVNGQTTTTLNQERNFIFDSGTSNVVLTQADAEVMIISCPSHS